MKTFLRNDYILQREHERKDVRRAAACTCVFIFLLVISLFVFLMLLIGRVKRLESDVEELRRVVEDVKVMDADVINALIGFEDEEFDVDFTHEGDQSSEDISDFSSDYFDKNDTENNETQTTPQYDSLFNLTKILREARFRRDIVATTQDGVVINSESYAQKKAANSSRARGQKKHSVTAYPARPSSIGSPWPIYSPQNGNSRKHGTKAPPLVYNRQSRVMNQEKPRKHQRLVKDISWKSADAYLDMNDDTTTESPDFTVVREERRHLETLNGGHPRTGRIKPLPSAHYNGDTTKYVFGVHTNYFGNGHLRHHQATFVDWKASDWVSSLGMDSNFNIDRGFVTVKSSGLYFVYAQIYYLDEHDTSGYRVFKNEDMILQCTLTIHSVEISRKGNTCFTAGVEHFSAGDKLSLADITQGRLSLFEKGKSFFGLVKLGDVKVK